MDDAALLALAADLVREAGAIILAIRAGGFATERKADASPVTAADRAAEALILHRLRAATPDLPVIAEEEVAAGIVTARADCFWLVDPLDGTKEFAAGRDDFTVNIGLVRKGRPVLGAVGVPARGELYGGLVSAGAHRRDEAGERPIQARQPPHEGLAVLASRSHANDARLAGYLAGKPVASTGQVGSSIKFCRIAEGAADLYPRFGRTMEWDTAAAQAVLEAAGGSVRTLEGSALGYGKPGWENPPFVAFGRRG